MSVRNPFDDPERKKLISRDPRGVGLGVVLAAAAHGMVGAFAMRAGADEGNVARATQDALQQVHEEEIIEGALLRQGGGGEFDPRTIHRQAPVRTEERAREAEGIGQRRDDAGAPPPRDDRPVRRDPNSLLTERDHQGHGNQDLAELARLEQAQSAAAAGAPPGPGDPNGSVNGSETDPARAGHGAQAKIKSFLERRLALLSTTGAGGQARRFRLRITISGDGSFIAAGVVTQGSGDETVDSDLSLQLAQLAESRAEIPELTDEEKLAIAGRVYAVRYP